MTKHHAFCAQGVRYDRAARRHREAAESRERAHADNAEAREDRVATLASLRRSRERIVAALAAPCVEHEAAPGCYCWDGGALSTVRGICLSRYCVGIASSFRPQFGKPEELAEMAQAARNARRADRLRLERRHPNRQRVRVGAR